MTKFFELLKIGERISGWVTRCKECERIFIARIDAEYCSAKCRQKAWKDKQ